MITPRVQQQDAYLLSMRTMLRQAEETLEETVAELCGPEHRCTQHRDRQPPWCPDCGRTVDGQRVQDPK